MKRCIRRYSETFAGLVICTLYALNNAHREHVLLMVRAGTGYSPVELWDNGSVTNGYNESLPEVLTNYGGYYRSGLIDEWSIQPPSQVMIMFINELGDPLFFVLYNPSGTNDVWNNTRGIRNSSLLLNLATLEYFKTNHYDFIVREKILSKVWYAVLHEQSGGGSGGYPKFLFTKTNKIPHSLRTDFTSRHGRYVGCYSNFVRSSIGNFTIDECHNKCQARGHEVVLLGFSLSECDCANFTNLVVLNEQQCRPCSDNPDYRCGALIGLFGVYMLEGSASTVDEWDPRNNVTYDVISSAYINISLSSEYTLWLNSSNADFVYLTSVSLRLTSSSIPVNFTLSLGMYNWFGEGENKTIVTTEFILNSGHRHPFPLIPATWITVRKVTDPSTTIGHVTGTLDLYGINGTNFVEAPIMTILGRWPNQDPDDHVTSPTTSSTQSDGCVECPCQFSFNTDIEITPEIEQLINQIKKNLTISKRTLSSFTRGKISAADDRSSSKSIGGLGIIIIVLFILFVCAIDLINYFTVIKKTFSRAK